jgi:uncharacterized protein (TIGR02302 family)
MNSEQPNHLDRKIALQRAALSWEDVWQRIQKPLLVVGVAIIVIASGILDWFPKWFDLVALSLLTLAFLYSLKALIGLKSASRFNAMRRMEEHSAIGHRSLSSHGDDLVVEGRDDTAEALWEEHKRRQLQALENVKLAPPRSAWRLFDPMALRVPVALAVFASLLLGSGDLVSNTRNTMNFAPPVIAAPPSLDAWLKPPSYTGKQPILLTSAAMRDKLSTSPEILIPENSSLSIRAVGSGKPRLVFYSPGTAPSPETEIKSISAQISNTEKGFTAEVKLDRPVTVKLFDYTTELASWPITLIPDEAPKIAFVEDPKAGDNGTLNVHWKASDDYGVSAISAEISLADEQENGTGFDSNGVFLYDAPLFKVGMKKPNAKTEDTTSKQDMSAHPWAGLYVTMVLTAKDAAGHTATAESKRFKLPERGFFRFLAKALIEQRKKLIMVPDDTPEVATMLDAFSAYPYSIDNNSKLILQMAAIRAGLAHAMEQDEVKTAVTNLWSLAVAIEDGELSDIRAQLRDLKQQLEQALKEGAPPERIAELMDKMRKGMDKLMDQMRKDAEKRLADGSLKKDPNSKSISREDLQKMLDDIEKLNKSGSKDAAQEMLSQLDQLLQNLQPGLSDQAGKEGDSELQQKMDELSDMMRKQQKLMDQTQKLPRPGEGEEAPDKPDDGSGALADKQGDLSDMLDRLNKQLGPDGQGELGDASKSMKGAKGSLKDGSRDDALRQQGDAMKQMRDGAKKLGKKLAEQGKGKSGQQGKEGEAGGDENDPLGRPRATRNPDNGPKENMVPSELSMRRAREILETLRQKYDDPNLGSGERAYIDRLLRGLY